jgi:predicted RNase H-like HicB family nuclease
MGRHVNVFYSDEDGGYIAEIPELKYCSTFGKTSAEALRQLELAKRAWLEVARKSGLRISVR